MADSPAVTLGLLSDFREKYTKKGDPMGILTVEDSSSKIEVVCFPRQWPHVKPLLSVGSPYVITGTVRSEGETSMVLDEIEPLEGVRERRAGAVRIRVRTEWLPDDFYSLLHSALEKFPGNMPGLLDLETPDQQGLLKMRSMKVSMVPDLAAKITDLSGGHASVA